MSLGHLLPSLFISLYLYLSIDSIYLSVSLLSRSPPSLFLSLCPSAENRKLLHEQDIERSLVELLSLEGDSLRTATCQAVAVMSLHLASKDAFRDLGETHTHRRVQTHTDTHPWPNPKLSLFSRRYPCGGAAAW